MSSTNAPVPGSSVDMHETDVLQILLELSNIQPAEWKPQFPFLDYSTVSQVSNSITSIFSKGKSDLKKLIMPLLRRWCTGLNKPATLSHSFWIGRSLTVEECIESVFYCCIPIIKNDEDWNQRDEEQQMALCYALLGIATNSSLPMHKEAGDLCLIVLSRILHKKNLRSCHHKFLAQIWGFVGELPIKIDTLTRIAERSFLGVERTMLWLGGKAIKSDQRVVAESFDTIVGYTLLQVCSQSSKVFQEVCNLMTHMMVVSQAHAGVQGFIKTFILGVEKECQRGNFEISALYEESCQILSALLCVDPTFLPEHGENVLSRQSILDMLHALPRNKAASLLSHRPAWLLFTF